MNSGCKGCEDRHVGCHGTCVRYKEFTDEIAELRDKIRAFKKKDYEYRMHKDKQVRKALKRK